MTERPTEAMLRIPERTILVPQHLSPQAREFLSSARPAKLEYPSLDDTHGWKRHVAATEAMLIRTYLAGQEHSPCETRELREGEALGYELTPAGVTAADRRVY